jgi:hypothetical protein
MIQTRTRTTADRAADFRAEASQAGLICATPPNGSHHKLPLDQGELLTTSGGPAAVRTLVELARKQAESDLEGEHLGLLELTVDVRDLQQWEGRMRTQLPWQAEKADQGGNSTGGKDGAKKRSTNRKSLRTWLEDKGHKPEV